MFLRKTGQTLHFIGPIRLAAGGFGAAAAFTKLYDMARVDFLGGIFKKARAYLASAPSPSYNGAARQ